MISFSVYGLSIQSCLENYTAEFHHIFMHVACDHGSVLFWQHNALYACGFVDDTMFSHNVPYGTSCIPKELPKDSVTALIPTKF